LNQQAKMFTSPFLTALFASFLLAVVIVLTQRIHGYLSFDCHPGVQKLHKAPTPRIGGLALLGGSLAGGFCLPPTTQGLWWLILLSAAPAFVFGLLEDVTKKVGVKTRLLATICAGLIFCVLTGYQITRVDILVLDWALAFWLPSILFTAFAIGGIVNAINIIDGVNGLASGTSIISLSGFAVVGWQMGDLQIAAICLVGGGALAGFFLLNFPMGKIFLGDAGAYATGFLLAAVAVALPARNPEVSPLIGLLALSYPVTETMVSIHRRTVREGTHPLQPDRLHLHSLIYRNRSLRLARRLGAPHLRNAIAGLMVMALPLMSAVLVVACAQTTPGVLVSIGLVVVVYLVIYRRVALLRRVHGKAHNRPEVIGLFGEPGGIASAFNAHDKAQ
jgi:UDP-N-acetylmuramyl pentapeptide phosphotransferase/UDP-N-acetylglucosamine-1-phosphate transferase